MMAIAEGGGGNVCAVPRARESGARSSLGQLKQSNAGLDEPIDLSGLGLKCAEPTDRRQLIHDSSLT